MMTRIFTVCAVLILCLSVSFVDGAKDEWNEKKSRHFFIYYLNAPEDFVETVEDAAEEYYEKIARNLGFTRYKSWTWDNRAKIYIFDDKTHYVNVSRASGWSAGHALTALKIIRTFPSAHGFFDSILPHELGHIIFREFVGEQADIPLWFEEGVAMRQEKAKRWGADKQVLEAIANGNFIPLQELSLGRLRNTSNVNAVHLVYSQSASAVNFMINKYGKVRFRRLLRNLKDGDSFDQALKAIYVRFDDQEELNKAWLDYLED